MQPLGLMHTTRENHQNHQGSKKWATQVLLKRNCKTPSDAPRARDREAGHNTARNFHFLKSQSGSWRVCSAQQPSGWPLGRCMAGTAAASTEIILNTRVAGFWKVPDR